MLEISSILLVCFSSHQNKEFSDGHNTAFGLHQFFMWFNKNTWECNSKKTRKPRFHFCRQAFSCRVYFLSASIVWKPYDNQKLQCQSDHAKIHADLKLCKTSCGLPAYLLLSLYNLWLKHAPVNHPVGFKKTFFFFK